jgi:hypothetical protein
VTLDDLADIIRTSGHTVTVAGHVGAALPTVQIVPRRLELHPGNRFAYHVIDVVCAVPLTPYGPKYDELLAMAVDVLDALTGTQYQLDPTIEHDSDADAQPPYQSLTINVRFAGPDVC